MSLNLEKLGAWCKGQSGLGVLLSSISPVKGTFPQVSVPPKSILKTLIFFIHFQKANDTQPQRELLHREPAGWAPPFSLVTSLRQAAHIPASPQREALAS